MRQLSSKVVYENAWMTVREDVVERLDGSTGLYGVVEKPDFAVVLPRGSGGFWMVEQFRYPIGRRSWEFPMGSWPGEPAGDAEALARTELAEETGLVAGGLRRLGYLTQASGYASQGCDVFLASGLTEGEHAREATELDMVHRFVTDAELDELIDAGEVVDACTLGALALYQRDRRRTER
jgi:8-oxo-dGTP pyrophosphatase MutT (NUDIX family)